MAVQDVLDLARVHVAPVADDQVLRAADDAERAVLVHAREVAGAQPAVVREHGARLVGPVPVALHHVVPADRDLAHASGDTSSSRISTPSTGVPIEPGRRGSDGRLNDATGEVSVSP